MRMNVCSGDLAEACLSLHAAEMPAVLFGLSLPGFRPADDVAVADKPPLLAGLVFHIFE